jgi:hypothetical protein
MDTTALKALTHEQLNEVCGLEIDRSEFPIWKDLLDGIRDAVIYENDSDAWDVPRRRDQYVHAIADQLTPNGTAERLAQQAVLKITWAMRLDPFGTAAKRWPNWINDDLIREDATSRAPAIAGRVVYLAYVHAVNNLVEWLVENQPEDDE